MLYAAICTDKPGSLEEDGTSMNGSLIVVEAASLEDARKLITGDPFAKAGIFASVEIRPWLWSINKPSK